MFAIFIVFAGLTISTAAAQAQGVSETNIRAGLWEVTTTSELLKLVPQMSSDQMQGLRDMAKQYGVQMPEISNGAASTKICVTPQMAKQNILPMLDQRYAGCETGNANRFGNRYSVELTCSSQEIRGKGSATGVFTTDREFVGKSSFEGIVQTLPVKQQADTRGKWISADCGNVGNAGADNDSKIAPKTSSGSKIDNRVR